MKADIKGETPLMEPEALKKTVRETMQDAVKTQEEHPDLLEELIHQAQTMNTENWPMPVHAFKAAGYLEPGDIVLMSNIGSFFSTVLHIFDKSRFAHCALVFQTPHYGDGIDKTFLIETSMSGVDLQALSEIVSPTKRYSDTGLPPDFVVGVKRLETDWSNLTLRKMAASRMLHFIDADDYNFRLLLSLASQRTKKMYLNLRRVFRGRAPSVGEFLRSGQKYLPAEFICSGFVQYAYVDMVRTAIERNLIDKTVADHAFEDVLFCPGVTPDTAIEELMACTPLHLANTEKLAWKYLIHRGEVFPVSSAQEVDAFFKDALPARTRLAA